MSGSAIDTPDASAAWSLRLLDHFSLRCRKGDAGLTARKAVALIIYLALQRDHMARRDSVANLLWSSVDTVQGRVSLRQAIAAIRRIEGDTPLLLAEADTVALAPGVAIDVDDFTRLAGGGIADRTAAAELYRTDLVAGFMLRDEPAFNEWLTITQAHWRQRAVDVLLSLSEAALAPAGDANAGISAALKLLSIDPFNEAAHRTLMQLYVRQGRAALALAQYRSLADLLRRELQVAPDGHTQALYERIRSDRRQAPVETDRAATAPVDASSEPDAIDPALPPLEPSFAVGPVPVASGRNAASTFARWRMLALALFAIALLAGGYVLWRSLDQYFDPTPTIARVYPIASGDDDERAPVLSPDGKLVVYSIRRNDNVDLYMTALDTGGDAVRLTSHAAYDSNPSWRPDGGAIAFVRQAREANGPCTILVRPMPIGAEREVGRCIHAYSTTLSWAADGKTIYFSEDESAEMPYRLHALTVATGAIRPITDVVPGALGDYAPSVSHDGRTIAYQHRGTAASDLALHTIATGATTILQRGIAGLYSIAWSADDTGLFYSVVTGPDAGLWWTRARPGAPRVRLSSGLTRYASLSTSASGRRLAVQVSDDRGTLLRVAPDAPVVSSPAPVPGFDTNGFDHFAVQARDGQIAFVSTRSGREQVWVLRPGEAAQPLLSEDGLLYTWLAWAPNGRVLAASTSNGAGRSSILLINVATRQVRRVVGSDAATFPAWSADGRHLYWTSLRHDRPSLVRMSPANPGPAERMMTGAFGVARFSRDGQFVYFTSGGEPGLRRRALDREGRPVGPVQLVTSDLAIYYFNNWVLTDRALVYPRREDDGTVSIVRRDLASGATTALGFTSDGQASPALSPAANDTVFIRRTVRQNDITGMDFD